MLKINQNLVLSDKFWVSDLTKNIQVCKNVIIKKLIH